MSNNIGQGVEEMLDWPQKIIMNIRQWTGLQVEQSVDQL